MYSLNFQIFLLTQALVFQNPVLSGNELQNGIWRCGFTFRLLFSRFKKLKFAFLFHLRKRATVFKNILYSLCSLVNSHSFSGLQLYDKYTAFCCDWSSYKHSIKGKYCGYSSIFSQNWVPRPRTWQLKDPSAAAVIWLHISIRARLDFNHNSVLLLLLCSEGWVLLSRTCWQKPDKTKQTLLSWNLL